MTSVFNSPTEVVAAWLLIAGGVAVILLTYYFSVIRQPPKPMLESLTRHFSVPASISKKITESVDQVKTRGKIFLSKYQKIELQSFNDPVVEEQVESGVIIGAPLDTPEMTPTVITTTKLIN